VGALSWRSTLRPAETPFDAGVAVSPSPLLNSEADAGAVAARPTPVEHALPSANLCDAPAYGTFFKPVALGPDKASGLLVWCRGGYALFHVREVGPDSPRLERLAFFPSHADAPGGAASGDFDGDGQLDLVLGVAPRPPLVHRAGAGVFFLRGRKGGGFDAPRGLAETPSVALAVRKTTRGDELWVLTRGEPAAQRPGELWAFAPAALPQRRAVLAAAVDPRDLLVLARGDDEDDFWVLAGDPGSLLRLRIRAGTEVAEARAVVEVRGAQAFVAGSSSARALCRDGASLLLLDTHAETPVVRLFAKDVRVGPAAMADFDGDGQSEVVAALPEGAAVVRELGEVIDLHLPKGVAVLAVASLADARGFARTALLTRASPTDARLSLLFPDAAAPPPGAVLRAEPVAVADAPLPITVPLE
jgi:hypothetical protein